MAEKLEIEILAKGATKAKGEIRGVGATTKELGNVTDNQGARMSAAWKKVGIAVGIATIAIKKGIDAHGEQIRAETALGTALRQQSQEMAMSVKQWGDYASALQNATLFGDEATLKQIAYIKTLDLSDDATKKVIETAMDYATAMSKPLDTAVKDLTMSLSGQASTLGRVFKEIKELTPEQLKLGDAIDIVATATKGQAEEIAKTDWGQQQQMLNTLGDYWEILGDKVLGAGVGIKDTFVEIKEGAKAAKEAREALNPNQEDSSHWTMFTDWVGSAWDSVTGGADEAEQSMDTVSRTASNTAQGISVDFGQAGEDIADTMERAASRANASLSTIKAPSGGGDDDDEGFFGSLFHTGGQVRGDEYRAVLQKGEMVINRAAVSKNKALLESINKGGETMVTTQDDIEHYAEKFSTGGYDMSWFTNDFFEEFGQSMPMTKKKFGELYGRAEQFYREENPAAPYDNDTYFGAGTHFNDSSIRNQDDIEHYAEKYSTGGYDMNWFTDGFASMHQGDFPMSKEKFKSLYEEAEHFQAASIADKMSQPIKNWDDMMMHAENLYRSGDPDTRWFTDRDFSAEQHKFPMSPAEFERSYNEAVEFQREEDWANGIKQNASSMPDISSGKYFTYDGGKWSSGLGKKSRSTTLPQYGTDSWYESDYSGWNKTDSESGASAPNWWAYASGDKQGSYTGHPSAGVTAINFNVSTNDSKSFQQSMVENEAVITGVVRDALQRNGSKINL